jgi:hypothetical protein
VTASTTLNPEKAMSTSSPPTDAPVPAGAADKPHPLVHMKELAAAGDLAGLLDAVIKNPSAVSLKQMVSLVRWAVREASKGSPRQFTRAIYREAMVFVGYLQMRLHAQAVRHLADADLETPAGPRPFDEQLDKLLASIERLMRLMQELGKSWAATAKAWKRPRRRRGELSEERAWFDHLTRTGVMAQAHALEAEARAKSAAPSADGRGSDVSTPED